MIVSRYRYSFKTSHIKRLKGGGTINTVPFPKSGERAPGRHGSDACLAYCGKWNRKWKHVGNAGNFYGFARM